MKIESDSILGSRLIKNKDEDGANLPATPPNPPPRRDRFQLVFQVTRSRDVLLPIKRTAFRENKNT